MTRLKKEYTLLAELRGKYVFYARKVILKEYRQISARLKIKSGVRYTLNRFNETRANSSRARSGRSKVTYKQANLFIVVSSK